MVTTMAETLRKWREESLTLGLEEGREDGLRQGLRQGIKQGMEQKQYEIAKNMLQREFAAELVSEITGLALECVHALRSEITYAS